LHCIKFNKKTGEKASPNPSPRERGFKSIYFSKVSPIGGDLERAL